MAPPARVARSHDGGRAAGGERRGEIGGVRGDAVARFEPVLAVVADLRVARVTPTQPAVPLDSAVVPAARVLADVAADGADVAQERRGRLPSRSRNGCVRSRKRRRCQVGERHGRADQQTVALLDQLAEPGRLQVDEERRLANPAVDLPGEVGAAGERRGAGSARSASASSSDPARAYPLTRAPRARGPASSAAPGSDGRSRGGTRWRWRPRSG